MSIDFQRSDYVGSAPKWEKVDAVVCAKEVTKYLRQLRKIGTGNVDDAIRQQQYEDNAIFYNIAGHTLAGLIGTAFRKDPSFDPPTRLSYLEKNADGAGNSIHQQARSALGDVLKKGRAGLWVDYPETEGETSRADIGRFFATIHRIEAEQIINWRTRTDGAITKLELVVIQSCREIVGDDGYELIDQEIITELALDEGGLYFTREWTLTKNDSGEKVWEQGDEKLPTDAAGNRLTEIPFTFVGSENNDSTIDEAPMLPLVEINIGHYRNSADFEDSVWYSGQSQPWMTGMDEALIELFKENDIRAGSRYIMPVPAGESFGFATPDPNPVVRQAMLDKVEVMIGLGAKFVTAAGPAKTAQEASQDEDAQTSILSAAVGNVADAYTRAVQFAAVFMGVDPVEYILDNDFSDLGSSPEMLAKWVDTYIKGAVPESDYIRWMQRQGYFDAGKTVEEVAAELDPAEPEPHGDAAALPGASGPETEE